MFCSRCGKQLADGEVCACRRQVKQQAPTAIGVLKKSLSSGLFLTIAILYSVTVLFSFITALIPTDYDEIFDEVEYQIGVDVNHFIDEFGIDYSSIEGGIWLAKVGSLILPGLICAGLWMLYLGAISKESAQVKTGGLKMLTAVTIIKLVLFCIAVLFAVFVITGFLVVASGDGEYIIGDYIYSFEDADFVILLCVVLFLILALVATLGIILFYLELKTLWGAQKVSKTGDPNNKASITLATVLLIGSALSVVLGIIVMALSADVLGMLTILFDAAFSFLAAVGLMIYRSKMNLVDQKTAAMQQPQLYTVDYFACEQCGQQYSAGVGKCPKCGNPNTK